MNMTTMRMYCPSLKENVEATITDGKQVASKGGSLRNIIYGEFEGKKCLPKTVKADVFAQHGFKAESVIIHGEKEGRKTKPVAHKVGVEEKDGFVPNRINIPSTMNPPYTVETSSLKTGVFENHAENSGKMNLTVKELMVLILVNRDWENNDWEVDIDGELNAAFYHDDVDMKKMRGVLSSLVKKGIITAQEQYVNRNKYTMVYVNNKYTTGVADYEGSINWNVFDCKDEIVSNMGYENFIEWASTVDESIVKSMVVSEFLAETFEARTHRKSYDWENRKFVKRPDGKHNPEQLRGYDHSPKGTSDSKLDWDSANMANTRIKANLQGKEDLRNSKKNAETFGVDVIHRKDGIEVGDNSIANEYQCGECDSVYDNSSDATICCKCSSCDEPIHEGDCIKNAETFEAESSPSSFDISWEDAQGVSSPSLPPEGIHFAEQGDYRMNGEGCEYCAETRELNAEGFCSECASHAESFSASSYEDAFFTETVSEMAAEGISRNGKLALSLTALGIGVAMALGSDTVSSLLDKITRK